MKSVLITGASTGIGEACAVYLAERGWRVFAGVRKQADAKRLAKTGKSITPLILDVTKSAQISQAVKKIQKMVGKDGLQGLVNNAGIAITGPLEFLPIAELRHQMDVNFIGQVEVTQASLPLLRAGRGRVINISSIGGRIVGPFLVPYSASKFALEAFSDGLRRELRPWKLFVSSIQAGAIDTPIWKKSLGTAETLRSGLPRQAESLYGVAMERARKTSMKAAQRGLPALDVAKLIEHILGVPHPRPRYIFGRGTWLSITLSRFVPDELLDWVLSKRY